MGYGDYDDGLDDDEEEEDLGPAVAVLDASSPTGEACVLQLLLLRRRVVAVVDDVDAARASFGASVKCVDSDASPKALAAALKGCASAIVPGKLGSTAEVVALARDGGGAPRVVCLSALDKLSEDDAANAKLVSSLLGVVGVGDGGEAARLAAPSRETTLAEALPSAGSDPTVFVRVPLPIRDAMGGDTVFIGAENEYNATAGDAPLSRVDVANVLAALAAAPVPSAVASSSTNGAVVVEAGARGARANGGSLIDWAINASQKANVPQ